MQSTNTGDFPYTLTRQGVIMTPEPGNELEAEGVLNPATGHTPDGALYLLPRVVASGNVSRVGLGRVVITDGVPTGVEREGIVLEPDRGWERGVGNSGVEDPRVTFIERLGLHVMTYVAYGPLGPRTAVAVSSDLRSWKRLGPALFEYDDALDMDLNLFHNKDTVFFPEPVTSPSGVESFAVLHRPMWDLGETKAGQGVRVPAGVTDERQSIWIAYVPVALVETDIRNLVHWARTVCSRSRSSPSRSSRSAADRHPCVLRKAGCCCTTVSPERSRALLTSSRRSTTRRAE